MSARAVGMELVSVCAVHYGYCSRGTDFFISFNLYFFHLTSSMWLVAAVLNGADLGQNSLLSGV